MSTVLFALLVSLAVSKLVEDSSFSLRDRSNWALSGHAKSEGFNSVRLTSTDRFQTGSLWSKKPLAFHDWEVIFKVDVRGLGDKGGEGVSFLLTEAIPSGKSAPFGFTENSRGIAVVFDSTDNDNIGNNPAIAVHKLDGVNAYSEADDGVGHQLAGCIADFRNRESGVTVKVAYSKLDRGTLGVYVDLKGKGVFQKCLMVSDVYLSSSSPHYMGFSAHTGSDSFPDRHTISDIEVLTDGGDKSSRMEFSSVKYEDDLINLDVIMHDKIDILLNGHRESVSGDELGQALDEVEHNVIRYVNSHFDALLRNVDHLSDRAARLSTLVTELRTVDLTKQETMIKTLAKDLADFSTAGSGENDHEELVRALQSKLQASITEALHGISSRAEPRKNGGGFSFWLVVMAFQVMFAVFVGIKYTNNHHMKLL